MLCLLAGWRTQAQIIYYSTTSATQSLNTIDSVFTNGTLRTTLFTAADSNNVYGCTAVAVDSVHRELFFVDGVSNSLWSINLDGTGLALVQSDLTGSITDLALDVLNQKIYYTTSSSIQTNNAIWCVDYTGNNNTKVFAATGGSAGVSRCTAIAVDVAASKIFFTDAGTQKIFSLNLDGTDLTVLVNLITSTPVDLTLDTANHRVYYASDSPTPILNYVSRINYDGTGVTLVGIPGAVQRCTALDIDPGHRYLYLSDAGSNVLWRISLSNGSGVPILTHLPATMKKLQVSNFLPTTTQLSPDSNPAVFRQSVTLTATVSPTPSTPSVPDGGSVTFFNGTDSLGTGILTNGVATLVVSTLPLGANNLTAEYLGGTNYLISTSTNVTETINQASTFLSVSSTPCWMMFGQAATLTATLGVVAPGGGVPCGTIEFSEGGNVLADSALTNGTAIAAHLILPVGTNLIQASFAGTPEYAGNLSYTNVIVCLATTTNTLTVSPNPSVFGQPVTFTANVTSDVCTNIAIPTGLVRFYDCGDSLGCAPLTNGLATLTLSTLAVGSHHFITAAYFGDTNFNTNTSCVLRQTVHPAATATKLCPLTDPTVFGQPAVFTVSVCAVSPGAGTPAGTVTLYYDVTNSFATNCLVDGSICITNAGLPVGKSLITASYSGNRDFCSSSDCRNQIVCQAATTNVLISSLNPSVYGQCVTFTSSVSALAPGAGTPTGTVMFYNGVCSLGCSYLTNGVATLTTAALPAGNDCITAVYSGDTNFTTNTSAMYRQTVNLASTTTSLLTETNPTVFGQAAIFRVRVCTVSPGAGTPAGTVVFYYGNTNSFATNCLEDGSLCIAFSTLPAGTNLITAVYSGNDNFNGSQDCTTQVVTPAITTNILVSAVNPSAFGQTATFTATVCALAPSTSVPTGAVAFYYNCTNSLGTNTLVNGSACLTNSALAIGTNPITAVYLGNSNFIGSTASSLAQVVFSLTNAQTLTPGGISFSTTNVLYLQTGLMQQLITVSNTTSGVYTAVRVTLHLTQSGITVYDATGTDTNGDPYLQYNYPVPAYSTVTFAVEYYVANRTTVPNPVISVSITTPADPTPIPPGTCQTILQSQYVASEGAFLIGFQTQLNATYYVLYSTDMIHWNVVLPSIKGTGSSVQWVDVGPPLTISRPDSTTSRYYRVIKAQ